MITPTSIEEEIIVTFFKISRVMRKPDPAPADLPEPTLVQLQALIAVKCGKVTMSEVAEELQVALPTATVLIDKLVKLKLITRAADASDRRITRLNLTEQGVKLLEHLMKKKVERMKLMLAPIPEQDKKELLRIFTSIFAHYEQETCP